MKIQVLHNERKDVKNVTVSMPLNDEQVAFLIGVTVNGGYRYDINYVWQGSDEDEGDHWGFHVCDEMDRSAVVKIYPETAEDFALYKLKYTAGIHQNDSQFTIFVIKEGAVPFTPIVAWNLGDVFEPKPRFHRRYEQRN